MLTVLDDLLHDVVLILPLCTPPTTTGNNRFINRLATALSATSRRARYLYSPHPFTAEKSPVQSDDSDVQWELSDEYSLIAQDADSSKLTTTQFQIFPFDSFVRSSSMPPMASVLLAHNMVLPNSSTIFAETLPPCHRRTKDIVRDVNRMRASLYDSLGSATNRSVHPN